MIAWKWNFLSAKPFSQHLSITSWTQKLLPRSGVITLEISDKIEYFGHILPQTDSRGSFTAILVHRLYKIGKYTTTFLCSDIEKIIKNCIFSAVSAFHDFVMGANFSPYWTSKLTKRSAIQVYSEKEYSGFTEVRVTTKDCSALTQLLRLQKNLLNITERLRCNNYFAVLLRSLCWELVEIWAKTEMH